MGNLLRIALFVALAASVVILFIVLNQSTQTNSQLPAANLQPEPRWPDTIRGAPLVAPTLAPNETPALTRSLRSDLTLPACTPPIAKPLDPPANFPRVPFPAGTKFYKAGTLNNDPNYMEVVGYAPLQIDDAVRFVIDELPKAGFDLGRGDSEPGEAESIFVSSAWRGGLRLSTVMDCDTITSWVVVVIKSQ